MQFLELLGCANGGMNTCSHGSVNVFARDRTGSGAPCSADRGSGRLRVERNLCCSPPCKQLLVKTSDRSSAEHKQGRQRLLASVSPRFMECF